MSNAQHQSRIPAFSKGDRYRKARETAGYSNAEFADLIGVSRNTITNVESDRVGVRKIVANAWSLATGVPLTWLETGSDYGSEGWEFESLRAHSHLAVAA